MAKNRIPTKKITVIALLSAVCALSNCFDITIGAINKFTLSYTVCALSGILFGPIAGGLTAAFGDLVGCLYKGETPFLPITLALVLWGVIPWLVVRFVPIKNDVAKIIIAFVASFLIASVGVNTTSIYFAFTKQSGFLNYLLARLPLQLLVVAINCVITCVLKRPLERALSKDIQNYGQAE